MKNFLNGTYFTKKVTEKLDENLKERENNKPVGTFEKNQKTDLTKLKTL